MFLTESLSTTGTVFSLLTSVLSTSAFELAKSDMAAELHVSTSVVPL